MDYKHLRYLLSYFSVDYQIGDVQLKSFFVRDFDQGVFNINLLKEEILSACNDDNWNWKEEGLEQRFVGAHALSDICKELLCEEMVFTSFKWFTWEKLFPEKILDKTKSELFLNRIVSILGNKDDQEGWYLVKPVLKELIAIENEWSNYDLPLEILRVANQNGKISAKLDYPCDLFIRLGSSC
ncbi:MAG: hypothetical protein R2788_13820 [Saprospiraceae bacterium]